MKVKSIIIGALCLGSLPFITGGASWNVPTCDSDAVLETVKELTIAKDKFGPYARHIQYRNIKTIKLHDGKTRTCVAEVYDKRNKKYLGDFYYEVVVTNGIKWVVGNIE